MPFFQVEWSERSFNKVLWIEAWTTWMKGSSHEKSGDLELVLAEWLGPYYWQERAPQNWGQRVGRAQVKAGICKLSSEMAGNLDFILNLFRVEGGLLDPPTGKWKQGVHAGDCFSNSSAKWWWPVTMDTVKMQIKKSEWISDTFPGRADKLQLGNMKERKQSQKDSGRCDLLRWKSGEGKVDLEHRQDIF